MKSEKHSTWWCRAGVAPVLSAVFAMAMAEPCAADVVTNRWIGADGAAWGTGSNWSENHVPNGDEYVIFPDRDGSYSINVDGDYEVGCFYVDYRKLANGDYDVNGNLTSRVDFTLTGEGSVTATGRNTTQHCVRPNRRLILDGPTLNTTGNNVVFLAYNGLVVKEGSTNLLHRLTLHWNNSYLDVQGGFVNVSSYLSYRRSGSRIHVSGDEGFLSASSLIDSDDSIGAALAITVDGGLMTVNTTRLIPGCSMTFNGGEYRFRGSAIIDDSVPLNFNGGTNSFFFSLSDQTLFRRFLVENSKTVVRAMKAASDALIPSESCTINAPLEIPGGGLRATNSFVLSSEYPLRTRILYNYIDTGSSLQSVSPTLRFPMFVFENTFPFTSGNGRAWYIEGPTTFRSTGDWTGRPPRTSYPAVSGPITIDTRDPNDEAVTHTVTYALGVYDDASLTLRGGGTVNLVQQSAINANPFNSVTVEEGTTLNLTNTTDGTDMPLCADSFTLGPNAVLNMTVGGYLSCTNAIYASKWNIDPTARINVIVLNTFPGGAVPVLVDMGSNGIADFTDRITVSGASAGGSLVRAGGSLVFVRKDVTAADGEYDYEWTGGDSSSAKWSAAKNWYCETWPPEKVTCAFGACDSKTASQFDKFSNTGSTIGQLLFRGTATSSFTISGNMITYNNQNASVVSYSALPQYVAAASRSTANIAFLARGFGPIVFTGAFNSKAENKVMYVSGDVRTTAANAQWPMLSLSTLRPVKPVMTRLFVAGGTLTFTNQTATLATPGATLAVAKGAKLTFKNGTASSKYHWTVNPRRIIVDGTLDLQAPFVGGVDQSYGGKGTLKVAALKPSGAASRVSLGDTVTLDSPAAWPTVDADGANTPLVLDAHCGRPVIHAAGGWTYGPAAGTTTSTSAADRAARIRVGAVLAVEPGGGVATFADPVGGPGTLEITNGTLKVAGGISPETSLAVAANGTFLWNAPTAVAGLSVAAGGALAFEGAATLTVSGDVSLDGVALRDADGGMSSSSGWRRILVAKSISGTPVCPSRWDRRLVDAGDGMTALEIHDSRGTCVMFR